MKIKIDYQNKLPENLTNKTFDVVMCMEVIEHVENVDLFVKSCTKLLKQ